MNKRIAFLSLILAMTAGLNAQIPVPVQKSENKIIIEGEVYYLHVVKAGQTLYSISRAYELKEDIIERENPGVLSGLRIGQVLKIPAQAKPESSEQPQIDTTRYIQHVLQKGETLFSLSRRYNVSLSEIEEHNPGIEPSALKEGQVIYFPVQAPVKTADEFIFHRVRRRETLYSISRQYDVSIEELITHNPELRTGTLRTGTVLTIPIFKVIIEPELMKEFQDVMVTDADPVIAYPDSPAKDTFEVYEDIPFEERIKRSINVAFLIPFNFTETDDPGVSYNTVPAEKGKVATGFSESMTQKPSSENYLEFIEGSLIAIDSLKKNGISVNMKIFDTRRDPSRMRSIISSGELNDADLIIGPFFSFNAEVVSEFSLRKKIPVILPFLNQDQLIRGNPYMFQLNPSTVTELNGIAEYVNQYNDYNIVLLYTSENSETERVNYLRRRLVSDINPFTFQSRNEIKELVYDPSSKTDLSVSLPTVLSSEKKNIVIIPSTNEAFVYVAVTQLYFQLRNYKIELFGMPQWSVFQNMDILYLHSLNLRYLTPYYFSYNDWNVKNFLHRWRKEFGVEPGSLTSKGCNYAFLGHDITWYFINSFHRYGKRFLIHTDMAGYDLLMNSFQFRKLSPDSGFENVSLKVIRFTPDLNIVSEHFNFRSKFQPGLPEITDDTLIIEER